MRSRFSPRPPSSLLLWCFWVLLTHVRVASAPCSLLIFDSFLPHGSGLNTSATPRATMWVSCVPVPEDETERAEARARRLEDWEARGQADFAGWLPAGERGRRPQLTPLGRKLLGLDEW